MNKIFSVSLCAWRKDDQGLSVAHKSTSAVVETAEAAMLHGREHAFRMWPEHEGWYNHSVDIYPTTGPNVYQVIRGNQD